MKSAENRKAKIKCEHYVPSYAIQLGKHTWCKEGRDHSENPWLFLVGNVIYRDVKIKPECWCNAPGNY